MSRLPFAVAVALVLFSCGSDEVCELRDCEEELRVKFRVDESWYTAPYEITVVSGKQTLRCFPLFPEGAGGWGGEGGAPSVVGSDCEGDLPFTKFEPPVLFLSGTPKSVDVTLEVEGETWIEQKLTPVYAPFYPNGEECEPVCQQATVIALPQLKIKSSGVAPRAW